MKCRACSMEATKEYCEFHERAYRSIVQKYDEWRRATEISWKEYLNEIFKNPNTGSWAKEVAEELIKSEER